MKPIQLTILFLFISLYPKAQEFNLIKKGAKLKEISTQFKFTEGPAVSPNGDIYFTDQPNNKIWKYSTKGELTLFNDKAGRSNGLFFDNEGNLIACADEKTELWKISPDGEVEVLLSLFENKKFNGPNDLWIAENGYIYFTDPFYPRPWWNYKEMPQENPNVYLYKPQTKELSIVGSNFVRPNGIIGNNEKLYVADIGDNKTYEYQILPDGTLSERKLFCSLGSDGMTLDNKGNLYLTGKGVTIFSPEGKMLHNIPVPQNWTANITFGGKKQNMLFITASEAVYTLPMKVKGIR